MWLTWHCNDIDKNNIALDVALIPIRSYIRYLKFVPRVHLLFRERAISVHSMNPPPLPKLDEQASGSKRKNSDQRKGQHHILESNSCHPRREREDENGRDDIAGEGYSDNGICNDLSTCERGNF
jgi:hypothetical protein